LLLVETNADGDLSQVAEATNFPGFSMGGRKAHQQKRRKERNDCHHNQEFE
jgi:hypothetical protein